MNKINRLCLSLMLCAPLSSLSTETSDPLEELQQEIQQLKSSYDQRLNALEEQLKVAQKKNEQQQNTKTAHRPMQTDNSFNPGISLILNGQYSGYSRNPENYTLPGYALGGEAGLADEGFSLGESELTVSANVDNKFYGEATIALANEDGETEVELEEAFIQTIGLGRGFTVKAGRFFSAIGYLNQKHAHAWNFADAPLIYRGLFGDQLKEDGLQVSYLLPTDQYLLIGAEVGNGQNFPGAGNNSGIGDWTIFANVGGDIDINHSWLVGLSHWQSDPEDRESAGSNTPSFTGESKISSASFVYKWAPDGQFQQRNLKLQAEYFLRQEEGNYELMDTAQTSTFDGEQSGFYAEAIYRFRPQWQTGIRYDYLDSKIDNLADTGSELAVLSDAGLLSNGHHPERFSVMLEWLPSEFSRIRAQFNHDQSYQDSDNQFMLQYTHSLGKHGAHQY